MKITTLNGEQNYLDLLVYVQKFPARVFAKPVF